MLFIFLFFFLKCNNLFVLNILHKHYSNALHNVVGLLFSHLYFINVYQILMIHLHSCNHIGDSVQTLCVDCFYCYRCCGFYRSTRSFIETLVISVFCRFVCFCYSLFILVLIVSFKS